MGHQLDFIRASELAILAKLAQRYDGGVIPVRLSMYENLALYGYNIKASIPGQSREVFIPHRDIVLSMTNADILERIVEEIAFAIFLLMDEDEDD
jgi:hypothetical protein